MYGPYTLEAWYPYLLIIAAVALIGVAIALLSDIKEQRKALGKSGWFDKPKFTEYTARKLAAHLITVGGILVIGLGVFAYQQGVRVVPWIIGVVGLAIASFGRALAEIISEEELRGVRWPLRRRWRE